MDWPHKGIGDDLATGHATSYQGTGWTHARDHYRRVRVIGEGQNCPELKGLKMYLHQYRNELMSYERCVNTLWDHLMEAFKPERLYVELDCNPRGGLRSRVWCGEL